MKKYLSIVLLAGVLFTGCKDNELRTSDGVESEETELLFSSSPTTKPYIFTTSFDWDAGFEGPDSDHTWVVVSPDSGDSGTITLNISVTQNNTGEERRAYMYIKTEQLIRQVTVIQQP